MVILVDYRNSFTVEIFCMMQGVQIDALWQPRWVGWGRRWEKEVQEEDHKYTYGWFMLVFGRDQHYCKAIILQCKK